MTTITAGRAIAFVVEGAAATKGSAKGFYVQSREQRARHLPGRVIITNDNPAAKAWQAQIAEGARLARVGGPLGRGELMAGAVAIELAFYLTRPLRLKSGQVSHTTRPDVDKLARCVLDGLTGVLYGDDGQVAALRITKAYAAGAEAPRVAITVTETTIGDASAPPLFT